LWLERPWHPYRSATLLIEADRLSNPQHAPDTERLRGGIERDRFGAPVAYWIRRTHPGDFMAGWLTAGAEDWERISARTEWGRPRVLHVHTEERTVPQPWPVGEASARGWPPNQRKAPPVGAEPSRRFFGADPRLTAKPDYRAPSRIGDGYE